MELNDDMDTLIERKYFVLFRRAAWKRELVRMEREIEEIDRAIQELRAKKEEAWQPISNRER